MQNYKKILTFLFVMFSSAMSPAMASPLEEDPEYQEALAEINMTLAGEKPPRKKLLSCPGMNLVISCGNRVCETKKGENEKNCPSDCIPSLVRSYNQQTLCWQVMRVEKPFSFTEVQNIVREAAALNLPVRVVGKAHSANSQLCTPGVVISTENLNRMITLETFHGKETVLSEAGVTLYNLADWLHRRNRSLGYAVIGFRGVSVAGVIATGSHGSSPKHSAVVSSAVESLWVVTHEGQLKEYSAYNTDAITWKALRANLGMLGVVVAVRFAVKPQFNLHVKVDYAREEELFKGKGVFGAVEGCDYALINWFPWTEKFMRTCGKQTQAAADPGATNVLLNPPVPKFIIKSVKKTMQFSACYPRLGCMMERIRYLTYRLMPPFQKEKRFLKGSYNSDNLIGPSHRMMSSEMTRYQHGLFQMDWEIAIPMGKAQAALEAVREHARKNRLCLPLVGVFLRFAPAEEATLLAHTVALGDFKPGETAMFIELPVYLPTGFPPELQAEYDRPYEELAEMLIERFSGRPHWGKNRDWIFKLAKQRDTYGVHFEQFQRVAQTLDPDGRFANDWSDYVGLSGSVTETHTK